MQDAPPKQERPGLGAVAAGHPDTAGAAAEILRMGGNAVDAAIAGIWASALAEAPLTAIGGGGFALVRTAEGSLRCVDFFVTTPGRGRLLTRDLRTRGFFHVDIDFGDRTQGFHVGAGAVAVPGLPAGVEHLHRRFGSLPMKQLVAPAQRIATEGAQVTPGLAKMVRILEPITCGSSTGRRMYRRAGRLVGPGDRIPTPGAAGFLETFATEGAAPFYQGAVARSIVEAVRAGGGYLTLEDMAAYRVAEHDPELASFAGITLQMPPPPSLGGALIAFTLRVLGQDAESLSRFDEQSLLRLCAALGTADAFRAEVIDPELVQEYRGDQHRDPELTTRYRKLYDRFLADPGRLATTIRPTHPVGSTTHLSVVAGDGSVCSVTTSNGEGSTVWIEDLGIHLNNMVGEEDLHPGELHQYPAGIRLPSMMAPTIVQAPDGSVVALGSGGSNRLRSAILQVVLHHLARGEDLRTATLHPRIHLEHGLLDVEPGLPAEHLDALEAMGLRLHRWSEMNLYFGGVHSAERSAAGRFSAAGDPRRGGVGVLPEA